MIDLETRLLEILDWDEDELERVYAEAARFLEGHRVSDRPSMERALLSHMSGSLDEEGVKILLGILDQNIIREARIIEE